MNTSSHHPVSFQLRGAESKRNVSMVTQRKGTISNCSFGAVATRLHSTKAKPRYSITQGHPWHWTVMYGLFISGPQQRHRVRSNRHETKHSRPENSYPRAGSPAACQNTGKRVSTSRQAIP